MKNTWFYVSGSGGRVGRNGRRNHFLKTNFIQVGSKNFRNLSLIKDTKKSSLFAFKKLAMVQKIGQLKRLGDACSDSPVNIKFRFIWYQKIFI